MNDITANQQGTPEGGVSRRELFYKLSPLGKLTLDVTRCTGCGLCAVECPDGAMIISTEPAGSFQLLFRHGSCTACGLCAGICPEKCLSVERTFEPDKMGAPVVLFEDKLILCSECGQAIGPAAMIDKLKSRVNSLHPASSQFDLCPECRVRAQFGELRV